MVHDSWSPYDFFEEAQHQQCLAHLLDRARNLIEKAAGRAGEFPKKTKKLLQAALDLRDRREKQTIIDF